MSTRYSQSSNREHSFIKKKKVLSIYYEPGKVAGTKDATANRLGPCLLGEQDLIQEAGS